MCVCNVCVCVMFVMCVCVCAVYAAENLRVLHVSREQREFLYPQMVTHHHVSVTIHGLSRFALVRKNKFSNHPVKGQVLFFLEPKVTANQNRLWVFLIPRNVPFLQVRFLNRYKIRNTLNNNHFRLFESECSPSIPIPINTYSYYSFLLCPCARWWRVTRSMHTSRQAPTVCSDPKPNIL